MDGWTTLTRRTEDPKLKWLENELRESGIESQRNGYSAHAPILQVRPGSLDKAWEILTPVDDIPDDDPRFGGEPLCHYCEANSHPDDVQPGTIRIERGDGDIYVCPGDESLALRDAEDEA